MKNIILIAGPAAGKGTEAARIKEEYNIPHISTGDLLRQAREENTEDASIIAEYQDKGLLVPFNIVLDLLKKRIEKPDCKNGYILDGFPRDLQQAEAYEKILSDINRDIGIVIVLDIDKRIAKSRIAGRFTCPNCGKIYNLTGNLKPKVDGICDVCSIKLTHRNDDTFETYEERYDTYMKKTSPLIEYYDRKGILYHVDSNGTPDERHQQVLKILEAFHD